jgi:phenylacetate-CoA ligase
MNGPVQGEFFRRDIETRTPDEQRQFDRTTCRRQIEYLFNSSPFYRRKFTAAGFRDAAAVGDLDDIAALPFTEKDEIRRSQAEHPPLGDHLAAPHESLARVFSTSGTTGDPVYMPVTKADLAMWVEISSRSYFAIGIRPGMTVVSTYNAGPFVAGAALDTLANLGVCHVPVGTGNAARLVRALQLLTPDALMCTPSYALYLAEPTTRSSCAARRV